MSHIFLLTYFLFVSTKELIRYRNVVARCLSTSIKSWPSETSVSNHFYYQPYERTDQEVVYHLCTALNEKCDVWLQQRT